MSLRFKEVLFLFLTEVCVFFIFTVFHFIILFFYRSGKLTIYIQKVNIFILFVTYGNCVIINKKQEGNIIKKVERSY